MKAIKVLFGVGLFGIALSLVMTVVTGYQDAREKSRPVPLTIPTPVIPQ